MESGSGDKMIERTVREILEESDMNETTEYKVRKEASERLKMDLSLPKHKAIVRQVVQSFLEEQRPKDDDEHEGKESDVGGGAQVNDADDDDDEEEDLVICKLSEKRKVTIQEFRGRTLVSIREYYHKGGKDLPTSKGISLTEEQWSAFRKNLPAIQSAIKKMESRST